MGKGQIIIFLKLVMRLCLCIIHFSYFFFLLESIRTKRKPRPTVPKQTSILNCNERWTYWFDAYNWVYSYTSNLCRNSDFQIFQELNNADLYFAWLPKPRLKTNWNVQKCQTQTMDIIFFFHMKNVKFKWHNNYH